MRHPARELRRIAFHLEYANAPTHRVRAFRRAAATVDSVGGRRLAELAAAGRLTDLPAVGATTAGVITEVLAGHQSSYLDKVLADAPSAPVGGHALRAALRGDCHSHSDWSDGGSPVEEMAVAARELGHSWLAVTDHSPRLTVARGLSPDRLRAQLDLLDELNERLAPFRVCSGIEVDILDDGALDQTDELLSRLDVVVASVHSRLRMDAPAMTRRMITAVTDPRVDVLGHCTGRRLGDRPRAESVFDAEAVFTACAGHDTAVEVNSRPDRLDPPRRLLRLAVEAGCRFAVDSDAHAPGQLAWLDHGCARAGECGVTPDRVINTDPAGPTARSRTHGT